MKNPTPLRGRTRSIRRLSAVSAGRSGGDQPHIGGGPQAVVPGAGWWSGGRVAAGSSAGRPPEPDRRRRQPEYRAASCIHRVVSSKPVHVRKGEVRIGQRASSQRTSAGGGHTNHSQQGGCESVTVAGCNAPAASGGRSAIKVCSCSRVRAEY